jgi:hypothetical protein
VSTVGYEFYFRDEKWGLSFLPFTYRVTTKNWEFNISIIITTFTSITTKGTLRFLLDDEPIHHPTKNQQSIQHVQLLDLWNWSCWSLFSEGIMNMCCVKKYFAPRKPTYHDTTQQSNEMKQSTHKLLLASSHITETS